MIICKLSDQLGNQMFAYAAVNTIAKDKGYDFRVLSKYDNQFLKNDIDKKFGSNITTVFENIQTEIIHEVPIGFHEFHEVTTRFSTSSLQKEALEVHDNTLMRGHYISPLYFMHRIDEVRTWFKFPQSINQDTSRIITKILAKYPPNTKLCSVHFRNALDYRIKGYMLAKHYWNNAAQQLLQEENANIVFLVFYDKKTRLVKSFIKNHQSETLHYSLFKDFSLISKCDFHIVCNSSFSVMAALMDERSNKTFCPSIWPTPKGYFPMDSYPQEWIRISTKRNPVSHIMGYIAPILSPLKHLIKKK